MAKTQESLGLDDEFYPLAAFREVVSYGSADEIAAALILADNAYQHREIDFDTYEEYLAIAAERPRF